LLAWLAWLLPVLATSGCGGAEETVAGGVSGARQAEWRWLEQTKRALDAQRERMATDARTAASATPAPVEPLDLEQAVAPRAAAPVRGERPAAGPALERQVEALVEEFNRRLVDFINADPPVPGEPLSPLQRQAIRMKSDEDVRVARAYIEDGGDYLRAFEILRSALVVDPDNEVLAQELERARSRRFMSRSRFAQVREGMTAEEVRALLGAPNPKDVRSYPDKGVVAWFYPKDPAGAAAAVWFERRADGGYVAYQSDFEAVRPPAPGPGAGPASRRAA
jgi:hypothetical protein